MTVKDRLEQVVRAAARRPGVAVGIVVALAVIGGLLALRLKPAAGTDTFVARNSTSAIATAEDHRHFGGDAVIILIKEPLTNLVETKDLATVSQLEACLGGQVLVANQQLSSFTPAPPPGQPGGKPPYGGWSSPCGRLMKTKPAQAVYGPGTFLNRAVAAVNTQVQSLLASAQQSVQNRAQAAYQLAISEHLNRNQALAAANAAAQLEQQQQTTQLAQLYLQSGIAGTPRIDDTQFVPQIVFDQTRGVNEPKARFAYLFPTADSALIQVRLKSSLTDSEQANAISAIRQAVKMPMFRSAYDGTYTVTGAPVVVNDLASEITGSIAILLVAALVVMALVLLIVFRSRLRLLPLGIAIMAAAITFGLTSLLGASLTMASIAVLPILIGLAVDYAIQFLSRVQEEWDGQGGEPAARSAISRAAGKGVPPIAIAALATATGFLALLLSPVPMVQGFGMLLLLGIVVAFACALTAGSGAIVLAEGQGGAVMASLRGAADILRSAGRVVDSGVRAVLRLLLVAGAGRLAAFTRGMMRRLVHGILTYPQWVIGAAAALALVGWVADTQTSVQSDVTKLVPSSMPALRDLRELERITGVSGEIDVTISARDVTQLSTVRWMINYQQALLNHFGYLESKGCGQSTICPALSLPDLFSAGVATGQKPGASLTQSGITSLLAAVPPYFSQAVITPDHHEATLAFGIRLMPLSKQQTVIDYMRSQLRPPPGVSAQLAGIPVLAAQANSALDSPARRLLTLLVGLLVVSLALMVVLRSASRAFVPMIPIALATGWSSLILFITGIPLNPMSATLGALVIAISTEFSVLLSERFHQEREAGLGLRVALRRTYRSTGAAVLASGLTAIGGFGVLVLSDFTMLRDFGLVTLIDLSVSLAGVLLVLPAVLVLSEREDVVARVRALLRSAGAGVPRMRGRARVA